MPWALARQAFADALSAFASGSALLTDPLASPQDEPPSPPVAGLGGGGGGGGSGAGASAPTSGASPGGTGVTAPATNPGAALGSSSGVDGQALADLLMNLAVVTTVSPSYDIHHDTTLTVGADGGVLVDAQADDSSNLTAVLVSSTQNGTLNLNSDGTFTYQPNAGFVGTDSFTFVAQSDSGSVSDVTTATIAVTDLAPSAPDQQFTVRAGQTFVADAPGLAAQATDEDDQVQIQLVQPTQHGTVQVNPDGSFTYQPDAGFVGTDTFVYRSFDGALFSDTNGTVTLTVEDNPPTVTGESYEMAAGGTLTADSTHSVLSQAYNDYGDNLTAVLASGPSHAASFQLNADGTFTYTPTAGFVGTDTFTFKATDGIVSSDPATVTINVSATPIAHDHSYYLASDGSANVSAADGVLANDFSPDGSPLSAVLVSGPSSGTLTLNSDGSFSYTADPNQAIPNQVTFTYNAVSAAGISTAVGTVTLAAETDAPSISVSKVVFQEQDSTRTNVVYRVTSDTTGVLYSNVWRTGDTNPYLTIAAVADKYVTVHVTFDVSAFGPLAGKKKDLYVQYDSSAGFHGGADAKVSGDKIDATVQLYTGANSQAFPSLTLTWDIGASGGPTYQVGTTQVRLYVLRQAPPEMTLYHTLVQLATKAAGGSNNENTIIQGVINQFSTYLEIHSAEDDEVLTYWDDWGPFTPAQQRTRQSTANLLRTGDGPCGAWAHFFLDVLRVQGITFSNAVLSLTHRNARQQEIMLIHAWALANPDRPGRNTDRGTSAAYPYLNTFAGGSYAARVDGRWVYQWATADVNRVEASSTPGQGTPQAGETIQQYPTATFTDHAVVEFNWGGQTVVFDPSYGKLYEGATNDQRLIQIERTIDFYALVLPGFDAAGNARMVLRVNPVVTLAGPRPTTLSRSAQNY
jgi:hypothetical protein